MSIRNERLLAKGARIEKQQKLNGLETEITALVSLIRMDLSSFEGLDGMNIPRACESAQRLLQLYEERTTVCSQLRALQEDWPQ